MAAFQKPLTCDPSLIIHLWAPESGMFFDVLLIAVKKLHLAGGDTRLQMFPHHQMPRLAETAPVASVEWSIIPGVIYFG